jgi:GDPmannose 4,6-dehydratase
VPPASSALITGLTGQDGSFLAELLLQKGYEVSGMVRGEAGRPLGSCEHLRDRVRVVEGDIEEPGVLGAAIERLRPAEIYHLAGLSFVPASWDRPAETIATITRSCVEILQAVCDTDRDTRVFVAASGAIFGDAPESPQREDTPCRPTTPYAIARLAAHQLVGAMRSHHGLYACSGILFNHESERRPEQFVTRRVTRAAAAISLGLQDELTLGSLEAVRDWSFAGDIVEGAWLMLQQDSPADFVLASGVAHTVAELASTAFACVELDVDRYLRVDRDLLRPEETGRSTPSVGDPTKAREQLGWRPRIGFEELVRRMVEADLRSLRSAAVRT